MLFAIYTENLNKNGIYVSGYEKMGEVYDGVVDKHKNDLCSVVVTPLENIIRYTKNIFVEDQNGNLLDGYIVFGEGHEYREKTIEEINNKISMDFSNKDFSGYTLDYFDDYDSMLFKNLGKMERGIIG